MVFYLFILMFMSSFSQIEGKVKLVGTRRRKEVIRPLFFSCSVNDISSNYSIYELRLQTGKKILAKVNKDGEIETNENIPGIRAIGLVGSDAGDGYLNVTIPNPRTYQSSLYNCFAFAHDHNNATRRFRSNSFKVRVISSSVREVIDFLLQEIGNLKQQLNDRPVESGIVECQGRLDKDSGSLKYQSVPVKFTHPFSKAPRVALGFTGEMVHDPLQLTMNYNGVTKEGFNVECFHTGAGKENNVTHFHWIAFE